jgi:hypothetical protein
MGRFDSDDTRNGEVLSDEGCQPGVADSGTYYPAVSGSSALPAPGVPSASLTAPTAGLPGPLTRR